MAHQGSTLDTAVSFRPKGTREGRNYPSTARPVPVGERDPEAVWSRWRNAVSASTAVAQHGGSDCRTAIPDLSSALSVLLLIPLASLKAESRV